MSKWLQAARTARASGADLTPSYSRAISANSADSPPERHIGTNGTIGIRGAHADSDIRRAHLAVIPDLADPEDIQVWLDERAAMREESGASRAIADKAAFDQLLWLWCAANPVEHAPGQCAACETAFQPPVMSLPDGATVCDQPDHACLIVYGNGRRMAAVNALEGIGIAPPRWWEL